MEGESLPTPGEIAGEQMLRKVILDRRTIPSVVEEYVKSGVSFDEAQLGIEGLGTAIQRNMVRANDVGLEYDNFLQDA